MIKGWLEIDGLDFNVTVTEISESATVLYSDNTGRTLGEGAEMTLDPLGTFFGHKVVVKRKGDDFKSFDKLYNYVIQPLYDGFHIKAVHNQSTIEYDAYISSAERNCKKIDKKTGKVYWDSMSISIISMKAQVLP